MSCESDFTTLKCGRLQANVIESNQTLFPLGIVVVYCEFEKGMTLVIQWRADQ